MKKIKKTEFGDQFEYHLGVEKLDAKRGGTCDVEWPDGTVTKGMMFESFAQEMYVAHWDTGAEYKTTRYELKVRASVRGYTVHVPIEDLLVDRVAQPRTK